MKDENVENRIVTLHSMGWSIRRISQELNISRKRIRRILVSKSVLRDTTPESGIQHKKQRQSKLDPYKSYIGDLLERYSDITGQRVYEHLQEKGFKGEITIVRDYLKTVRVVESKTPVRMVETDPGQRASHDWSDYRIQFTINKPGDLTPVTFFSYILGYSRRQYISVVDDKKQPTLFRELIAAFIYLDGVPREIKSDNQKACVDRWEMGRGVFNAKYLDFATWYRFQPKTITPGNPTENLKVERSFYYLERSFLNGRKFKDIEDLKKQLRQWLTEVNDLRIHRTTRKKPIDMYTEEHPFLQPLPANHYDTSHVAHLVVNQESCVQWKGYQYVVPQKYMYELCPVRITEEHLVVYSPNGEQLATHPLAKNGQKGRYVGVQQKTGSKPDLSISDVVSRLEAFAPEMGKYIEQIKRHKSHSWGYHLRKLLTLKVNYRIDDIMVAVRRAQQYKVYDAGTIEGFLVNNSEPRYSVKLTFKPRNNNDYDRQR
ncbi:MAG: IS21 family transposase [Spirochaetales bacterium]|jgi:transposase|nr:IS21 family transposase [Spirochaetales bacterium]